MAERLTLDIVQHTPHVNLEKFGRPDIFLKLECEQFAHSFKTRGIINFLKNTDNVAGLVTFTTGNHGIALAAIAKKMGIPAVIISSHKLSDYKRGLMEDDGATVQLVDFYNAEQATEYAKGVAAEMGFTFVPLFDNEYILQGYSSIADEICYDVEGDLTMYFPIGSGSLVLANGKRALEINPNNRVIGVEPAVYQRLNGIAHQNNPSHSIADSLSIDRIPACNANLREYTEQVLAIDEHEIAEATKFIFNELGLLTEPGGAITLAAALRMPKSEKKKIAVITGKNMSMTQFQQLADI